MSSPERSPHTSEAPADAAATVGAVGEPRSVDLRAGVYEHFKGHRYLVLGTGHDANHAGRTVVVYVPLYQVPGAAFAVRDLDEFCGWVHTDGSGCGPTACPHGGPTSTENAAGEHRPRFRYLGLTGP